MLATVIELLLRFADTGRIGLLHLGMPFSEAEALLGEGTAHPAIRIVGPDTGDYPYYWGCLALYSTGGTVTRIGLTVPRDVRFSVPVSLLPPTTSTVDAAVDPATDAPVGRTDFLAALDQARCSCYPYDALTFGEQSAIRTEAGTIAVFAQRRASRDTRHDEHYLFAMHHSLGS